ncbi:guanylate kinase [Motilimonas pumila]|uniref:Guanylate kinase n=1 Tax=Motilimonas pumila TaxID=2303987 RepID=A0A418YH74_9GAMM|nr:guanylate kinase [Motilimonas pumila]RJG49394.1 guanylate kinase [Motilimonas pumila]
MSVTGTLYIVSAPSGAGKSSLIKALLEQTQGNALQVSVSHTTRDPRPGEVNGQHYHFVGKAEFQQMIAQDDFFEWAEVFGNFYGTSKKAIEASLAQGIDVFLDIDWQGARQVKQLMPASKGIFILPPSREALEQRLQNRGQDSDDVIAKRMAEAQSEMSHYNEYDFLIINDDFEQAVAEFGAIIQGQRLNTERQSALHHVSLAQLLA